MDGINTLLRYIQYALFPIAAVLLLRLLLDDESVGRALISMVAAVVGMVPEGLVLLTSLAFGIAAVTLARRQVLVQELPAVEGLARVDVVCLDKTGTLTEGDVVFDRVETLGGDHGDVDGALGALANDDNRNATLEAVGAAFTCARRLDAHRRRWRSRRRGSGRRRRSRTGAPGSSARPR